MAEAAGAAEEGGTLGLIASFGPTLQSMPAEFPPGQRLELALAEGALEALNRGDGAPTTHWWRHRRGYCKPVAAPASPWPSSA